MVTAYLSCDERRRRWARGWKHCHGGGSARVSTVFFFQDFDIKVPAVLGLHEASTAFRSKSDTHLMQNLNFRRDERAPWLKDATVESRSFPHALRLTPKTKTPLTWIPSVCCCATVYSSSCVPGLVSVTVEGSLIQAFGDRSELSSFKEGCLT